MINPAFDVRNLDRIEAAFSAAALDSTLWRAAMEISAEVTGAYGAIIMPSKGPFLDLPYSRSLDASAATYLSEGWFERDERFGLFSLLLKKHVVVDQDIFTDEHIRGSAYYQDFLARFGLRWFAAVAISDCDHQWNLSLQRSIAQGPFLLAEQRCLAQVGARLGGPLSLARALGYARAEGVFNAFELSDTAICLVDKAGDVWRHNAAADALFGQDLSIKLRRLTAADRGSADALHTALHRTLWSIDASPSSAPVVIRRTDQRPIVAYVVRLPSSAVSIFAPCRAIVTLVDTGARRSPSHPLLQTLFGLTPAEARLASRIATGASLEQIAVDFGISIETARSQLKAIMSKTNTSRQGELVASLVSILAGLKTS